MASLPLFASDADHAGGCGVAAVPSDALSAVDTAESESESESAAAAAAAAAAADGDSRSGVPSPEALHPGLWRADQLGQARQAGLASGFSVLDDHLPGGGWPAGVLTELLLPHPGVGELRLLAPALCALQRARHNVMWFDPPAAPCAWALAALGIDVRQLVVVRAKAAVRGRARELLPAADILWALEHALRSGHVGAVLAWLPLRLPADALRRLQLGAQNHPGPAFLLRDAAARHKPSPAPLRLLLNCGGPDALRVSVLKRRGPPVPQPLLLALPRVLGPPLRGTAPAWPAEPATTVTGAPSSLR